MAVTLRGNDRHCESADWPLNSPDHVWTLRAKRSPPELMEAGRKEKVPETAAHVRP